MKKLQYILLFLLTMAVGCSDADITRSKLALYADYNTDSRTSFNGSASAWSDNDQLKAIVNGEAHTFGISNTTSGQFVSNEEVTTNSEYDIYALYAASDASASIDATSKVANINIGAAEQTQNGISPSHVALFDPLYGKVENASEDNLHLTMHHTAAALKVIVKNSTGAAIEGITSVKITVPDSKKIFGSHTVDFTSSGAGSPISAATSGSNSITVTVDDSGSVAIDESFVVWAATAPFELASGEKLNIVVTADDKEYAFEKTIGESGASFTAGGIMQTTVELEATPQEPDPAPEDKPETIVVEFGDLEGGFVPEGLPKEGESPTTSTYSIGNGLSITIDTNLKYYYREGYDNNSPSNFCRYIRFEQITNYSENKKNDIKIMLPPIHQSGYRLTNVNIKTVFYANRGINIGIIDSSGNIVTGEYKIIKGENTTINIEEPSTNNSQSQYYIHIYRQDDKTSAPKAHVDIQKVTLTYTLEK